MIAHDDLTLSFIGYVILFRLERSYATRYERSSFLRRLRALQYVFHTFYRKIIIVVCCE